jgi:hypothetical protein
VPATEVDETAKIMSRLVNDQEVWVMYHGFVKAIYCDGNRETVHDLIKTAGKISSPEWADSKIRDSETNEWI